MGNRKLWKYSRRIGQLLAAGYLCQQLGCLPDQAFQQVLGQNIVLTAAVFIQSVTSLIFNSLFGVI